MQQTFKSTNIQMYPSFLLLLVHAFYLKCINIDHSSLLNHLALYIILNMKSQYEMETKGGTKIYFTFYRFRLGCFHTTGS